MLGSKALLLSGKAPSVSFTVRITASDENGLSGTFSCDLDFGFVVPVYGSTSLPFAVDVDTINYTGKISLTDVRTQYPLYKIVYKSPYRTQESNTYGISVSDPGLTDGDEVNITIKTNSSA